jgi:hypothetical protein
MSIGRANFTLVSSLKVVGMWWVSIINESAAYGYIGSGCVRRPKRNRCFQTAPGTGKLVKEQDENRQKKFSEVKEETRGKEL